MQQGEVQRVITDMLPYLNNSQLIKLKESMKKLLSKKESNELKYYLRGTSHLRELKDVQKNR